MKTVISSLPLLALQVFIMGGGTLFDSIYPVGSIYISVNNTNPNTLFGGTWEQIKDRFLLACGNTYKNGAVGGESAHTLNINEMPSHTHDFKLAIDGGSDVTSIDRVMLNGYGNARLWGNLYRMNNTGGNASHNNMPPYLAVYIWKRIR